MSDTPSPPDAAVATAPADIPDPVVSRTRRVARWLVRTSITLVIVFGIAALVPKVLSLALGTPHPLATITSSSMWPELKRGDLVLIKSVTPLELEPGMIVAFSDPGGQGIILHRIVEIEGGTIITKGDANETEDDPIVVGDIIGAVPTIGETPLKLPLLGYVTLVAKG